MSDLIDRINLWLNSVENKNDTNRPLNGPALARLLRDCREATAALEAAEREREAMREHRDKAMTIEREDEVVETIEYYDRIISGMSEERLRIDGREADFVITVEDYKILRDTIAALKAKCEKAELDFRVELEMRKHSEALLAETRMERDKALDSYLAVKPKCVELEKALHAIADGTTTYFPPGAPNVMTANSPTEFIEDMWGWSKRTARFALAVSAALPQPSDTQRDG